MSSRAQRRQPGRPRVPQGDGGAPHGRGRGPAGGVRGTWRWEYVPDEAYVVGGAPPAFVAEVEKQADGLVRAAAAFCLDGASYQEAGPKGNVSHVPGGFFL
ncbi:MULTISPECIES: hypothetical protein [Streptomyces]|uniref:Uncharacterized protein n=1 Tax=Streptomyces canarius TaxID=285453 RepID=A0ABQ3CVP0_9ACTN|nr:hypothetical protein [Streptomyces canarius]GHA43307.1 hypothetical protein GCM10010345_54830 [Streptomyces canarius]